MWINDYINSATGVIGILLYLFCFIMSIIYMASGRYFIRLKNYLLNGIINFVILCAVFCIIVFLIYYLSISFYDCRKNIIIMYLSSIFFYSYAMVIVFVLLCGFFHWLGCGDGSKFY